MNNNVNKLEAIALVIAPLLFLASELIHPITQTTTEAELASVAANYQRWYFAHILVLGAIILLPFALMGLYKITKRYAEGLSYFALALSLVGVIAVSGLTAFDLIVWQIGSQGPTAEMVMLYDRITQTLGFSLIFLTVGPLMFVLGVLLFAYIIYSTKPAMRWQAIQLGIGMLLYGVAGPVFPIANGHLIVIFGAALLVVSMGTIGIRQLKSVY